MLAVFMLAVFMLADLFSSGRCGSVFWRGPPYSLLGGVATVPWAASWRMVSWSQWKFEELFVALYKAAGFFSTEVMVLGKQWWKKMVKVSP